MLVGAIGIPVILNHSHKSDYVSKQSQNETVICQEAKACCETELIEQETLVCFASESAEEVAPISTCECNFISSFCCCFIDVRLVSFVFYTPINESVSIPSFVQAFVRDIGIKKLLSYCSYISLYNHDLPPPKTYSQQLALFQVYRI
tara:strand:+ start:115 stop:555 length:441 start_codon:yes stop_codon:yes gene_type:complete